MQIKERNQPPLMNQSSWSVVYINKSANVLATRIFVHRKSSANKRERSSIYVERSKFHLWLIIKRQVYTQFDWNGARIFFSSSHNTDLNRSNWNILTILQFIFLVNVKSRILNIIFFKQRGNIERNHHANVLHGEWCSCEYHRKNKSARTKMHTTASHLKS